MRYTVKQYIAKVLLIGGCLLLTGCESAGFYYQAIAGQMDLLSRRQPIDRVLSNPQTPDTLKEKLNLVQQVRTFARDQLQLPVDDHYSQYADLERPYAVWNVFAAPEFSIKAKTWCYPIAGCVAYKGFFAEADAKSHAESLSEQGLDVYVGGVAAYSTLGWFQDPVLNTFIHRSDPSLAGLLIHELAHQQLYVPGDSAFNESFATTVEILGLNQWLENHGQQEQQQIMAQHRERKAEFVDLILAHRDQLDALYQQEIPDGEKRKHKAQMKQQLLAGYEQLKTRWGGYAGFDRWFEGPLNNAQLATIATYHHWVDSFMALFHQQGQNWQQFYAASEEISKKNKTVRDKTLEELSVAAGRIRL